MCLRFKELITALGCHVLCLLHLPAGRQAKKVTKEKSPRAKTFRTPPVLQEGLLDSPPRLRLVSSTKRLGAGPTSTPPPWRAEPAKVPFS